MALKKNDIISPDEIVNYYDDTISQYKRIWKLNDNMAMHYGFWMDEVKNFDQALQKQNEVLVRHAAITDKDYVLDAGCGVGGSSVYMARHTGCRVKGITLSKKQIGVATENAKKHGVSDLASFEVKDFTKTGFPDNTFDVIWAVEAVCHAPDKRNFIHEAFRILKPGGRLIMSDGFSAKASYTEEETEILNNWLHNWAVPDLAYLKAFLEELEQTGFTKVESKDMTPYVMRSAKKMKFWAKLGLFHNKTIRALGLKRSYDTEAKRGNMIGSLYQYPALVQGLSKHCIVYAEKLA